MWCFWFVVRHTAEGFEVDGQQHVRLSWLCKFKVLREASCCSCDWERTRGLIKFREILQILRYSFWVRGGNYLRVCVCGDCDNDSDWKAGRSCHWKSKTHDDQNMRISNEEIRLILMKCILTSRNVDRLDFADCFDYSNRNHVND